MKTNIEKVGDIFEGQVRDIASDGRGVIRHDSGRAIFVAGVWLQEQVRVRLTQVKGRVGTGECVAVLKASEHRVAPFCPHQGHSLGRCGGCAWQMIEYQEQLRVKQHLVASSFARLGVKHVEPIWPSPNTLGYRNRAQLKTNGQHIGYLSAQSHQLAAIADCLILSDHNRSTLRTLMQSLPNAQWQPRKKHDWVTLDIDDNIDASKVSVNKRLPFMQANDQQNTHIREWLNKKLTPLNKHSSVLELFAGSGNLTRIIAGQHFANIIAAEGSEAALAALEKLNLPQVQTLVADLFNEPSLNRVLDRANEAEILVLDPPRDGLKLKGNLFAKKSKIKQVFYISCDLATLTRDLTDFVEHKFKIKEVQPLDQFPHTPHIEVLVHLSR